jgi:hypothetical protein
MSKFPTWDGLAPRLTAAIFFMLVLAICTSCDRLVIDEIICPPVPPVGESSYLPVSTGARWIYDYEHHREERYGSLTKEATIGTLTLDVTSVQCTNEGVTFRIRERIVAEKTDTVIVGWCCVEDPDTVVTHSSVDATRTLYGFLKEDFVSLTDYAAAPGDSGHRHPVPEVRWRHPVSESDTVTVGGLMQAGFGYRLDVLVTMVRGTGMSQWVRWDSASRPIPFNSKTVLALRAYEP